MVYTKNEKADAKRRRMFVCSNHIILHNNKAQNNENNFTRLCKDLVR